jgi:hypothetical protein
VSESLAEHESASRGRSPDPLTTRRSTTRLACLLFIVLTVVHTWPYVLRLPSSAKDYNDAMLNIWALGAIAQQLVADPLHPFDVNMFYPFESPLALLDPQLTNGVLAAPVTWLSGNPVLGANLLVFASFVLCGFTMFLLVRELTGSAAAGLVAGCLFAFAPSRTERLSHSPMLAGFWLPVVLLCVHRYVADPKWRRLLAVVGAFVALSLSSWYFAAMGMIAVLVVGAWSIAAAGWRRDVLTRGVVGAVLVFLLLLPFGLPFARAKAWEAHAADAGAAIHTPEVSILARVHRMFAGQLDIQGRAELSAQLQHYVGMGPNARLWSALRRYGWVEGSYFPGVLGFALAFAGLWSGGWSAIRTGAAEDTRGQRTRSRITPAAIGLLVIAAVPAAAVVSAALGRADDWTVILTRRLSLVTVTLLAIAAWSLGRTLTDRQDRRATIVRTYVALMVAGMVLSFGPRVRAFGIDLGTGLYPAFIPPFGSLRVAARFGILYVVGLAVVAGFGVAWVEQRLTVRRQRLLALAGALVIVNAEMLVAPMTFSPIPRITAVDTWLKHAPAGAVVDFPIHANPWALVGSLFHRKPLVNGAGLVAPPPFARLNQGDDLSPAMLEHLRAYFHPRYVVVRRDVYASDVMPDLDRITNESHDDLRLLADVGNTRIFELRPGSRGPRVRRWYPASLLEGKRGITLNGHLEGVPRDAAVIVTLAADGVPLASWTEKTFLPDIPQFAPFKARPGRSVTIDLAADYWLLPDAPRPDIATTGVRSAADVQVSAGMERSSITVNNRSWVTSKGYTLAAVDPVARQVEIRTFNTSWYEEESDRLAAYVASLPAGRIVAVATNYDVSRRLNAAAVQALRTLGFQEDLRGRPDAAHGGVGVVGAAPGTAVECAGRWSTECGAGTPAPLQLKLRELRLY